MYNEFETTAYVAAYVAGNQAAKNMPEGMGLFQMADAAGYERESIEWHGYVDGGAALIFKNQDLSQLAG